MTCEELDIAFLKHFKTKVVTLNELEKIGDCLGYQNIEQYKKVEKSIDKYLKRIYRFEYKDFSEKEFEWHKRNNGGIEVSFDKEYFLVLVYEDKGEIINFRINGYEPSSLFKFINNLNIKDVDPDDKKYGFSNF